MVPKKILEIICWSGVKRANGSKQFTGSRGWTENWLCIKQRHASKLGVEAYQALIKAQQINDSEKEFENIEEYLAKWNKLSNCNKADALFD